MISSCKGLRLTVVLNILSAAAMIGPLRCGNQSNLKGIRLSSTVRSQSKDLIFRRIRIRIIQNKNQGLESLLMRVFQLFSEDLMFHQMENYFCCLLEFGKKIMKLDLNTALSFTAKTSWKNPPS